MLETCYSTLVELHNYTYADKCRHRLVMVIGFWKAPAKADLQPEPGSPATETLRKIQNEADDENLLAHRHHLVVQALWQDVEEGLPDASEWEAFQQILEALIESIATVSRLELHPAMLNFYHLAALSTHDDLEAQKHYLQLEHRILQCFYPDEAQRQEDEIMALVKCNAPPTKDGLGQMDWWKIIRWTWCGDSSRAVISAKRCQTLWALSIFAYFHMLSHFIILNVLKQVRWKVRLCTNLSQISRYDSAHRTGILQPLSSACAQFGLRSTPLCFCFNLDVYKSICDWLILSSAFDTLWYNMQISTDYIYYHIYKHHHTCLFLHPAQYFFHFSNQGDKTTHHIPYSFGFFCSALLVVMGLWPRRRDTVGYWKPILPVPERLEMIWKESSNIHVQMIANVESGYQCGYHNMVVVYQRRSLDPEVHH